jgi:hypothetical protein
MKIPYLLRKDPTMHSIESVGEGGGGSITNHLHSNFVLNV